jgi:hypothetical protein
MKKTLKYTIQVEVEDTEEIGVEESIGHVKWAINKMVDELNCEWDGVTATVTQVD